MNINMRRSRNLFVGFIIALVTIGIVNFLLIHSMKGRVQTQTVEEKVFAVRP